MSHGLLAALIGALVALVIVRGLQRWQFDSASRFDIQDLLLENGQASRGAVVMMGAFVVTSWLFVYYTLSGKMTEGYFGLYVGAWVTPVVVRMLGGKQEEKCS